MNLTSVLFVFLAAYEILANEIPAGILAECPGMNKTTTLSQSTLKSLSVVVRWPASNGSGAGERRCKMNRAGAACVAEHINFNKTTQVIVSGYLDVSFSPLARTISELYIARGRNVIVMETFPILVRVYPIAARLTKPLGEVLGIFIAELNRYGLKAERLELIGGSLGAHIVSNAAAKYHQIVGKQAARLTGLDPAGPCFRKVPYKDRFNAFAAKHVDALHTNIDGFGIAEPVAQVDFYANGGEYQPLAFKDLLVPCLVICSHVHAALYWISAMKNPSQFVAVRCNSVSEARRGDCYDDVTSYNELGATTNFNATGVFYLPTSEIYPYYRGKDGLKKRPYKHYTYLLNAVTDDDIVV